MMISHAWQLRILVSLTLNARKNLRSRVLRHPGVCTNDTIHPLAHMECIPENTWQIDPRKVRSLTFCRFRIQSSVPTWNSFRLDFSPGTFFTSNSTMSESMLSLNCFILGDDPESVFPVDIQVTSKIGILKDLIKEKNARLLAPVDAKDLDLFQVR